jgi:hypothetical protein
LIYLNARENQRWRKKEAMVTDLGAGVLRLDHGPELGDLEPLPFPRGSATRARHASSSLLDLAASSDRQPVTDGRGSD